MIERCRLLQVTDTHLYVDTQTVKNDLKPYETLRAVLDKAFASTQYDAVLATGDLTQEADPAIYQQFNELVHDRFDGPMLAVPGNHDLGQLFDEWMPTVQLELKHWTVIGLDTHVDNEVAGHVQKDSLAKLKGELEATSKHVLVVGHHPLTSVHAAWLDAHQVDNAQDVLELMRTHENVRGYLCGHVHQQNDEELEGMRFLTTPSTCWQFARRTDSFAMDTLAPGWRSLELYPNGSIETQVHRLR